MESYDQVNCILNQDDTAKFFGDDLFCLIAVKKDYQCVRFYPNGYDLPENTVTPQEEELDCVLTIDISMPKVTEDCISQALDTIGQVFLAEKIKVQPRGYCRCGPPGDKRPC